MHLSHEFILSLTDGSRVEICRRDVGESETLMTIQPLQDPSLSHTQRAVTVV